MKKILFTLFFLSWNKVALSEIIYPTNWENFLQHSTYLPCASSLFQNKSNSLALLHAKKASFATGKIIESLDIISLTYCYNIMNDNACKFRENKTIATFEECALKRTENISDCFLEYPYVQDESSMLEKIPFLSSLGLHDACYEIPGYHYCSILVMNQPIWAYGICVPDVCSPSDVELSLNKLAYEKTNFGSMVSTNKLFHSTCGDFHYSATSGSIIMISVCFLIIVLVFVGTILDFYWNSIQGTIYSVFKCFSLKRNVKYLLEGPRGGPFDCFDGIRVLSILWVIFGHTFVFSMMALGFTNLEDLIGYDNKGWISTYPAQALTSAYFAVDTFFFMSGFLAMYILMKAATKMIQEEKISLYFKRIPIFYVKRFLRLTPVYFFILFVYLKIFPLLESGPFWNLLDTDITFCNQYWWTNLLYINNLYPSGSEECYAVTWYLANDFQFFILVPLFAFFTVYSVKNYSHLFSIGLLSLGSILSIVFSFVESYKNHWSINIYDASFLSGYFPNYYIKPWFRCPPYLLGMSVSIIWFHYFDTTNSPFLKTKNELEDLLLGEYNKNTITILIKKNIFLKISLFLVSLGLFTTVVLGGKGGYSSTPSMWSDTVMSLYIALSKPTWTIGLSILSILLFVKELSLLQMILTNHFMAILSRLTFCMYLIHPCILYWYYFSQIYPFHYNDSWYTLTYLSVVLATTIVSIIVHVCVEKPISNLEKMLF